MLLTVVLVVLDGRADDARDGAAERAFVAIRTPEGARAWATTTDAAAMSALETEEVLGGPVAVVHGEVRI